MVSVMPHEPPMKIRATVRVEMVAPREARGFYPSS